ncbi:GNAT family N-acetyltransferase [Marivibrio halodurans]|uniref:GNAT family N-acetyltransferase n=1 Tax=Marivibrio halodurans TaxID=2039722 RepID=A0A8J7S1G2_9PROT|nr:GNAT family protein [Marivibrio halodurans]MBP5858515.1 GNAT family N-acetyltransferase [Marivibrio halodurans]
MARGRVFGLLARRQPRLRLVGPSVSIRCPQRRDRRAWIAVRQESKGFLEPWEPVWPRDALTPGGYRRRLERFHSEWHAGTGFGFFLFTNDGGHLVGGITLANVRRGVVQSANVGYWTGEPYIRRGYMFEGVQLCLDFAFRHLSLHRIEAACLIDNEASRQLLLKSGFRAEGVARKYLCIAGKWQDHETFAILSSDPRPSVPVVETT